MAENGAAKKLYTMEEMFGVNSDKASQVLDCMEEAIMTAKSTGELYRITKIGKHKLRELRQIGFQRDRS